MPMPNDNYIMVLCTCNSSEIASLIAETLVSEELAACVNIVNGIESVYRWKGEISRDNEILLLIKTREILYPQVETRIRAKHDYELPEIIAVPIATGEKNYLNWIESMTASTTKSMVEQ